MESYFIKINSTYCILLLSSCILFVIMIQMFLNSLLGSISDTIQNPVTLAIFIILIIIIISLVLATIFNSWREFLVRIKFLEEEEKPSSLLLWFVGVILLVKLTQIFLLQPFIVDGGSMLNTFHNKEFLLVDKLSYRLHEAHRGDVMIFKLYEGDTNQYRGKYLIKRVIGLPSERIVIQDGVTTIYNNKNPNGFVLEEPFVTFRDKTKNTDVTLNDHQYFMMGDNRSESYDSRSWGPLEDKNVQGQVLLRILPISTFSYEPGRFVYTK